jgi:hypothetical protein
MTEDINLQIAELSLRSWADRVIDEHYAVEDCYKCDEYLEDGIKAFKFVNYGEMVLREAAYRGLRPWTIEVDNTLKALFAFWAKTADEAELWIARIQKNGYELEHLAEFRKCREAVDEWIESRAWTDLSQATMGQMIDNADL